jgi:hypothetical protein
MVEEKSLYNLLERPPCVLPVQRGYESCTQVSETFELQFRCRIIDLTPQARCDNLVQIAFLMRLINGYAMIAFAVIHETR